jgi:hypothetical protein
VELRLEGELHARYQSRYVEVYECGAKKAAEAAKGELQGSHQLIDTIDADISSALYRP